MKARLTNVRISARKIGLAAKLVRNLKVSKADVILKFAMKKSAVILRKLISSAVANAVNKGENPENLKIKSIFVGPGPMLKRFSPRAKGSASRILKKTSNVLVILDFFKDQLLQENKHIEKPDMLKKNVENSKINAKQTKKKKEDDEGTIFDEDEGGE